MGPQQLQFPGAGSENGIQALAGYVHRLGLKFGIYETAGNSDQAVSETPRCWVPPTPPTRSPPRRRRATTTAAAWSTCDYSSPGAQAYVDSVVDELAYLGVDYVKLDGITDSNVADIRAWSAAIRQSGRPMVLDITEGYFDLRYRPGAQAVRQPVEI